MARNFNQLNNDLLSRRTFDQVSYYGTLCGDIIRRTTTLDSFKGGDWKGLSIQVETHYYFYMSRVWKFSIVTDSAHGYQVGEVIKASWQIVQQG